MSQNYKILGVDHVHSFYLCACQVLSGDCIVIRGQAKGGPPPERVIALSNIVAPRLARKPQGQEKSKDEVQFYTHILKELTTSSYICSRLLGKVVST